MLYSGNEESNNQGHNPNVNNNLGDVKISIGSKIGYWILIVISLGLVYIGWVIPKKNYLNRLQIKINESVSNIEIQLQKRVDTLSKLIDGVKGHIKFNKDVYENIAALRSGLKTQNNDIITTSNQIDNISKNINLSMEAYPNLGADSSINKMLNEATMIERELAASRRLYNAIVTEFNQAIFTFPTSVIAAKLKYHGLPLFAASKEKKQDVKISF